MCKFLFPVPAELLAVFVEKAFPKTRWSLGPLQYCELR